MKPWKRVEPTEITKLGWRTVVTKNFVLPDGKTYDFQMYNKEGTHFAGVIALTKDKQVITAYQFRPGPERMMHEIPGGGVDADDVGDYQKAALRELREETGYVPGRVTSLGIVYKDAYNNGTWHYYLVEDCELDSGGQQLDDHEFIEVRLISIAEFLKNAQTGRMTDVEAVFLAYDRLKELASSQG